MPKKPVTLVTGSSPNEVGICPYCNSDDIEYGSAKFEGDMLYFPCTCNNCKRNFEEWNEISFVGNNVGNHGKYDASDVIGKEIEYVD